RCELWCESTNLWKSTVFCRELKTRSLGDPHFSSIPLRARFRKRRRGPFRVPSVGRILDRTGRSLLRTSRSREGADRAACFRDFVTPSACLPMVHIKPDTSVNGVKLV